METVKLQIGAEKFETVLQEYDDSKSNVDINLKHNKNLKKYEEALKTKPIPEKQKLVYLWTKKMMEQWESDLEKKIDTKAPELK